MMESIYGDRLVQIVLYGSQARGDAAPDSDVDILVVLRGEVNQGQEIARTSADLCKLDLAYNAVFNVIFMDEERFRTRFGPLLRNIRKDGIAI